MSFSFGNTTEAIKFINMAAGFYNSRQSNGYFKVKFPGGHPKVEGFVLTSSFLSTCSYYNLEQLGQAIKNDNTHLPRHRTYQTIDLSSSRESLTQKGATLADAINRAGADVFQIPQYSRGGCGRPPAPTLEGHPPARIQRRGMPLQEHPPNRNPYAPRRRCPSRSGEYGAPVVTGGGRPPRKKPAGNGAPIITGFDSSRKYGGPPKRNPDTRW